MSRGGTRDGELSFHPKLTLQICSKFSNAEVDLLATQETSQRKLWFSLSPQD